MYFPALANRGGDEKQDKEDVTKRNSRYTPTGGINSLVYQQPIS